MVKDLLRWEDSPGLEHHCPRCATPLNNPRAKHTCYFKHVEICSQFHQHFFLIGQAHNCETCRRNAEVHDQRHRQLAILLRQLSQLQQEHGYAPSSPLPSPGTQILAAHIEDLDQSPIAKLKKRERKKAKKRIKALKGGDALTAPEIERVSMALHPPGRKDSASTAISDDDDEMSSASSTTSADLDTLAQAHMSFCPAVNGKLNACRMALQTELMTSLSSSPCSLTSSVDDAMSALDVPAVNGRTPKAIAELVTKIRDAVQYDLACAESDQKKFRVRQVGWYRFVNRSILALSQEQEQDE